MVSEITGLVTKIKSQLANEINKSVVFVYWNIGKIIVSNESEYNNRLEYGKEVLKGLSDEHPCTYPQRTLCNTGLVTLSSPTLHSILNAFQPDAFSFCVCSMWDLSSPTRDQICDPYSGSMGS